jgi:hypothetical protein
MDTIVLRINCMEWKLNFNPFQFSKLHFLIDQLFTRELV